MPTLSRKPDIARRPPQPFMPSRKHTHGSKNSDHEFDRVYRLIQKMQVKLRDSVDSEGRIVNSSGSPLAPGTILGWDSSGNLALSDASSGALIRPVIVSPDYIVGVNERFIPLGTGDHARVATDGAGTFVEGDRLFCSATAGVATLTAPTSPNEVYSVGYVSGDHDDDADMIDVRLNLGFGTTINARGILIQDPNDPFDTIAAGNITATLDGTDMSLVDALAVGTVGANTNMTWYGTQTYPLLDINAIPYISSTGVLSTDTGGLFWNNTNNTLILGDYVTSPFLGFFWPRLWSRQNGTNFNFIHNASNTQEEDSGFFFIKDAGTLASPNDIGDDEQLGQITFLGHQDAFTGDYGAYASIIAQAADASAGLGRLNFYAEIFQNTPTIIMEDGAVQITTGTGGAGTGTLSVENSISAASGAMTGDLTVADEAYGSGWNGSLEVPTKNAVYDKIELVSAAGGNAAVTRINKTANETTNTDTTLSNDATLLFSVLANTKYGFRLHVAYNTPAAADFKFAMTCPAASTLFRVNGSRFETSGSVTAFLFTASGDTVSITGTGTDGWVQCEGILQNGANAGSIAFQWAQDTSDASNTTVYAGSYIEYWVVS